MTWQKQSRIASCGFLLVLLLRVGHSLPQNFGYYTHILPQQQVVPQQIVPHTSNLVVLPPGIAQLTRMQQQYAAAAGSPLGQLVLVQRDENPDEKPEKPEKPAEQGWGELFVSFLPHFPIINPAPENPEKPTVAVPPAGTPAKLEELEPASPAAPGAPAPANPLIPGSAAVIPDQKFILGQPQYFGNYDGLKKLGVKNLGNKGVIPNFLLVRGNPGIPHLGGKPEPEKLQDTPGQGAQEFMRYVSGNRQAASAAGQAAFDFQKYLAEQQRQADSEQGAIVVNADRRGVKNEGEDSGNEDGENVEATHPNGPSVAQVKPQAIALAGPGGVAAAAPVGTALVGPGGLAVAAPAATAVAGPSGGAPPIVAPAQNVLAAYLMAHANRPYVALSR